jgi:hypothetical protein
MYGFFSEQKLVDMLLQLPCAPIRRGDTVHVVHLGLNATGMR